MKEEINDENLHIYINGYVDSLPSGWNTTLDMKIAMKNAMLEALAYPEKYIERKL